MVLSQINKITVLGTGRLASQLSRALFEAGCIIHQVYGRNETKARSLAESCNARHITDIHNVDLVADMIIICITDDAIEEIVNNLEIDDRIIVHTSGSLPADIFKSRAKNYGVFYPLQTFSKQRTIDFRKVPVCIEANSSHNEGLLMHLAQKVSDNVQLVDSDMRLVLHTAAVFACNFTNQMYSIAEDLLNQHNLDFELLRPLIEETALKVKDESPAAVQTGPALRRDQHTINKHLQLLEQLPRYRDVYMQLTELIMKKYNS